MSNLVKDIQYIHFAWVCLYACVRPKVQLDLCYQLTFSYPHHSSARWNSSQQGVHLEWPGHHLTVTHLHYHWRQRRNTLTKWCHTYVRFKWHSLQFILQWVLLTAVSLTCLPEQFLQSSAMFACQMLYPHGIYVLLQLCTWNLEVKISVQIEFVKQNSIWQFDISVEYVY